METLTFAAAIEALATGEIEVLGVLPYASNYTFLAKTVSNDAELLAVYKPRRGERPLWDFPPGTLARRELCAFLVSEAAGFSLVPPTVLRSDGPLGEGSLQLFIDHDPERHYFTLREGRGDEFRAFAAFDVVVNNADRKAGHVLEDVRRRLWAVDHGVTFHREPKLRTVIWEFAEQPLGDDVAAKLAELRDALSGGSLPEEIAALRVRARGGDARDEGRAFAEGGDVPGPERAPPPTLAAALVALTGNWCRYSGTRCHSLTGSVFAHRRCHDRRGEMMPNESGRVGYVSHPSASIQAGPTWYARFHV